MAVSAKSLMLSGSVQISFLTLIRWGGGGELFDATTTAAAAGVLGVVDAAAAITRSIAGQLGFAECDDFALTSSRRRR